MSNTEEEHDPSDPIEWEDLNMPKFLLIGSFITLSCDIFLYPFDLIKTRLQVQGSKSIQISFTPYNGLWDGIKSIIKLEGFRALYKGFGITLIGYFPAEIFYYGTYEFCKSKMKNMYRSLRSTVPQLPSTLTVEPLICLLAGGVADLASAAVWIPCDVLQQKLMVQGPLSTHRSYHSGADAIQKIWKNDGFKGFYRGSYATCVLFASQSAVGWMVYEKFRRLMYNKLSVNGNPISNSEKFFIYSFGGSLSAVSAAIITNPLDVVKTRLQVRDYHSQSASLPTNTTTSITAVLRTIVKEEGYPALMRGTLPRIFYYTPVGATTLILYETVKSYCVKV